MEINNSNMIQGLFVSIVIPVYNVEKYLDECLNSILNQTYTDYELILVDDGSQDRSGEICDSYVEMYGNIHVFHQSNQGQAAARNLGVEKAKADWVMFVDSDDVVHPQLLEYLVRAQKLTGARISACHRAEGERIPKDFFQHRSFNFKRIFVDQDTLFQMHESGESFYWALFPSLIDKKVYQQHQMPSGRIYEDNAVCCRWLHSAKVFAAIPEQLYFYRKNPNSTMNNGFSVKQLDYLWALNEQLKFYHELNLKKMLNAAFKDYVDATIWICNEIEIHLNDSQLRKRVLRESLLNCRRYQSQTDDYDLQIERLEKKLHPLRHRIKKRIKRRIVR